MQALTRGRAFGAAAAAALIALSACAEFDQRPSALPPDVAGSLAEAARQADALSMAPGIGNANRRAGEAAVQYAVLRGIAEYPTYAGAIVAEALRLSPAYGASARASALAAYPAFAATISAAAPGDGYAPSAAFVAAQAAYAGAPAWEPGAAGAAPAISAPYAPPVYAYSGEDVSASGTEPAAQPLPPSRTLGFGVTELWLGALAHDAGSFGTSKEDSGPDIDLGVRFEPLEGEFWNLIANPRPHWGFHVNTRGDTSQTFGGLSWEFPVWDNFYVGADWGLALHNGKLATSRNDRKELGLRILFREAVELGYRFDEHSAVSFVLDHISNGRLGDHNDGLDDFGLRYTYRP